MIHFSNYLICYKKCKRVLETHMYVYMMQSFIQFCRRQSTVRGYEANVLGLLANPTKHNAKMWSIHLIEHHAKVWINLEVIQSNRWDAVLMLGATLRPFLETVAIINFFIDSFPWILLFPMASHMLFMFLTGFPQILRGFSQGSGAMLS